MPAVSWWHDATVLAQVQVVLALLSVCLLVVLGAIAWWLARKHTEVVWRLNDLAQRQRDFFLQQLAQKTDLRVIVPGVATEFGSDLVTTATASFHVHNAGRKSADGFYWEILLPGDLHHLVSFVDEEGERIKSKAVHVSESESYRKQEGHYTQKLFPSSAAEVARIRFRTAKVDEFLVKWRIRGEDGTVPASGLAEVRFTKLADGSYEWSAWRPPAGIRPDLPASQA
jgi:hypothetical protein